jgi:dUTP pyrophosphatase
MPMLQQHGGWIDLYSAENISVTQKKWYLIHLGVIIKMPPGYEALIVPRSSSFKYYGLLQTNSPGVIDNSYCGEGDEWLWSVYATKDAEIKLYDRICQFRILKIQPEIKFNIVSRMMNSNRGGFGSTGIK